MSIAQQNQIVDLQVRCDVLEARLENLEMLQKDRFDAVHLMIKDNLEQMVELETRFKNSSTLHLPKHASK